MFAINIFEEILLFSVTVALLYKANHLTAAIALGVIVFLNELLIIL
jgi:hypothetical protein